MRESALQVQIEAAKAYDDLFVPALTGQWVSMVADTAQVQTGRKALDVACGTGILTREVASRIGKEGTVVGLDPNPGMLSVANDINPDIDWQQGMAEEIPFSDQSFDIVLSQFGLMFFKNPCAAIQEMLRVMKSAGRLVVAVWDAIENIAGYLAEMELIEHLAGKPAGAAVRAPFALGNLEDLNKLFAQAGAASVEIATQRGTARFPSIRTMVEAELRGWLPVMGVHLTDELIGRILKEAETTLSPYVTREGTVAFDVTAHIVAANKD